MKDTARPEGSTTGVYTQQGVEKQIGNGVRTLTVIGQGAVVVSIYQVPGEIMPRITKDAVDVNCEKGECRWTGLG